jgi:hypothetical protein
VVDSLKKWALAEIKFDNNKLLGKFSSINDFPYDLSIRGAKDIRQEHHDLIAGQIKEQKEKNPKLSPKNSDTNKLQNKNQNNQGTTSGLP